MLTLAGRLWQRGHDVELVRAVSRHAALGRTAADALAARVSSAARRYAGGGPGGRPRRGRARAAVTPSSRAASPPRSPSYETRLDREAPAYLADHRIEGVAILPATAPRRDGAPRRGRRAGVRAAASGRARHPPSAAARWRTRGAADGFQRGGRPRRASRLQPLGGGRHASRGCSTRRHGCAPTIRKGHAPDAGGGRGPAGARAHRARARRPLRAV